MILNALAMTAGDLLVGLSFAIATACVIWLLAQAVARTERHLPERERPEPTDKTEEAFSGPHPHGWPPSKPGPVAEAHLGKDRIPERRRAA